MIIYYLHSQDLQNLIELKNNIDGLKDENRKLQEKEIALQESCKKMKKLIKKAHWKISAEQQQVS